MQEWSSLDKELKQIAKVRICDYDKNSVYTLTNMCIVFACGSGILTYSIISADYVIKGNNY